MRPIFHTLLAGMVSLNSFAQNRMESTIPISVVTREAIEKDGRFDVNLTALLPAAKGGKNYSAGAGLSVRFHLGDKMNKVAINSIPQNEIERVEVIKGGTGLIYGADALSGVVNIILRENPLPANSDQFYYMEEKRWNVHVGAGIDYLAGKKETVGMYSYSYDPLSIVHTTGGVTLRTCSTGDLALDAGPAMAVFSNGTEWGYRLAFSGAYQVKKQTNYYGQFWNAKKPVANIGICGGVSFNKFREVDPLLNFSLGVRASF